MVVSKQILVVEDIGYLSSLWKHMYARNYPNIDVTVANTINTGLHTLHQAPVDLLIVDYHLPDGTGIELLEQINRRQVLEARVLVTANPYLPFEDHRGLYDQYFIKPVMIEDILALPRIYLGVA